MLPRKTKDVESVMSTLKKYENTESPKAELIVGKITALSSEPPAVDLFKKDEVKEAILQQGILFKQQFDELKDSLKTIESSLAQVAIIVTSLIRKQAEVSVTAEPYTKKAEFDYTDVIDYVKKLLIKVKESDFESFKWSGQPSVLSMLSKNKIVVPDTDLLKSLLKKESGFTYNDKEDSFSYAE